MTTKRSFTDIVSIGEHDRDVLDDEFGRFLSQMHRQQITDLQKTISCQKEEIKILKAQVEAMERFSIKDALTETFNRRFLQNTATKIITNEMRGQRSWGILMVDVDYFKKVNDQYGHPAGDAVLQNVAKMLQHISRDGDFVIRYGGEEFLVLVFNVSESDIERLAQRYRTAIAAIATRYDEHMISVTASIGVCFVPGSSMMCLDDVIICADKALYRAKDRGRDCVEMSSDRRNKLKNQWEKKE